MLGPVRLDGPGMGRVSDEVQWTGLLCAKDMQDGVGCDQKKGMWAARELAREGLWIFHNLQLFAKKSLSS
jgi:hypothetical protein